MNVRSLKEITTELSLLYVEDDKDLRDDTSNLFSHLFSTVETAENGQVALNKLKTNDYDLIITDIDMPLLDGVALTRNIREQDTNQAIIITSAHNESHYLLELIELGIDKFILKPLDIQQLISTLFHVCSNIRNKKLINMYKKELESTNLQLKSSNDKLASVVKALDTKLEKLCTAKASTNKIYLRNEQN